MAMGSSEHRADIALTSAFRSRMEKAKAQVREKVPWLQLAVGSWPAEMAVPEAAGNSTAQCRGNCCHRNRRFGHGPWGFHFFRPTGA